MENQVQSKQNSIQAVIFDLDGVLMDTEWMAFQAWRQWSEDHGGNLKEVDFPGMAGLTAEETARYVIDRTGVSFDIAESSAWSWEWMLARIRGGCDPLPGSVELVRSLSARGYPLAIASNANGSYIDEVLAGLGLTSYFPLRVSIEHVLQGKPAPDIYLRAAQELGVAPEHCLAIEDSRVGVQAASAARMRVIAVPGSHDHSNGFDRAWRVYSSLERVVEDLDDLLP